MHSAQAWYLQELKAALGCCWVDVMIDDEVIFDLSFWNQQILLNEMFFGLFLLFVPYCNLNQLSSCIAGTLSHCILWGLKLGFFVLISDKTSSILNM